MAEVVPFPIDAVRTVYVHGKPCDEKFRVEVRPPSAEFHPRSFAKPRDAAICALLLQRQRGWKPSWVCFPETERMAAELYVGSMYSRLGLGSEPGGDAA